MADDIYLSPEEQDERARQWFKDNAPALAIGIALGLAAVVGYNKYQDQQQIDAEAASALFQQTVSEIRDSELSSIDEQIDTLKSDYAGTSYAAKAMLLKAKQTSVNDLPAAYDELQWVIDNSSESGLKHIARIRQAKIKLALNDSAAAKALASYTPTQGFASHYQEVLGDVAIKEGDENTARSHYQAAVDALDGEQDTYVQVLNIKLDRLPPVEVTGAEKTTEGSAEASANEAVSDSVTTEVAETAENAENTLSEIAESAMVKAEEAEEAVTPPQASENTAADEQ